MAAAENPDKRPLTRTLAYVDRVQSSVCLKFSVLYWGTQYHELTPSHCTVKTVEFLMWVVIVTKGKDRVSVTLSVNEYIPMIQGFVVYQHEGDNRRHSTPVTAIISHTKMYVMEFPFSVIESRENIMLKQTGYVCFGFMYEARRVRNTQISLHLEERDEKFSLIRAQKRRLFTDFTIRASGETFPIHKAVLRARSAFFHLSPHRGEDEITLDAAATSVQNLVYYLYSGELLFTSLNELLKVQEVAVKLFVVDLSSQLTLYFCDIMTKSNVERIWNLAFRINTEALLILANEVIATKE